MDRFEQLKNRRPGHLTPDEITWLISRVESLGHQIEEYENPIACGHFGVNNQPDDSNNYFCIVCQEVESLQVKLTQAREALKIAAPAVLANLNHFWSLEDIDKFRQALAGDE